MTSTTSNNNFHTRHSLAMQLACVFLGTALILLIPLLAMQFTEKVNWDLADFLAAGVLLAGTGLAYVLLVRKLTSPRSRLVAGALLGLAFLLAWAELAVGLFH